MATLSGRSIAMTHHQNGQMTELREIENGRPVMVLNAEQAKIPELRRMMDRGDAVVSRPINKNT